MAPAVLVNDFSEEQFSLSTVKELADSGIKKVPDCFRQPEANMEPSISAVEAGKVMPVIDLSGLEDNRRSETLEQMKTALTEWGFFQIVNHGVPIQLMGDITRVYEEFLTLPVEEKMKFAGGDPRVSFGAGNRYNQLPHPWKDYLQLVISGENPANWPDIPHDFRETELEYNKQVAALKTRLVTAIIDSIGLGPETQDEAAKMTSGQVHISQLYPSCPEVDAVLGVQPHSDTSSITILHQDMVGGLDCWDWKLSKWVDIQPIPNCFSIFIGDQFEIFTNGKYESSLHRVRVSDKARISMVTFFYPEPRSKIVCPAPEILQKEPAKYRDSPWSDYLNHLKKLEADGFKFLVERVKIPQEEKANERNI